MAKPKEARAVVKRVPRKGKNSPAAKGPGLNAWTKMGRTPRPKEKGC